MKFVFCAVFLSAALFGVLAAEKSEDGPALNGVWVPVQAELGGAPMPEAVLKAIALKLQDGAYEVTVAGEAEADRGLYALYAGSKPKGIRITGVKGPNAGKNFPAIYELNGDTLRVCYDLSGAARPTEFKTRQGTQLYLVTYTRKKPASDSGK